MHRTLAGKCLGDHSSLSDVFGLRRVVLVCVKHSLSPSVKAGGYGTAGWAVGGDIIIDVHKLIEVDIEIPKEDGSFTSLRDVAAACSKGKDPVEPSRPDSQHRRVEDSSSLRQYDSASQAVASFLHGSLSLSSTEVPLHTQLSPLITSTPAFGSASGFSPSSGNLNASSPFSFSGSLSRQLSQGSATNSTLSDPASGGSISRSISTALTTPALSPVVDSSTAGSNRLQENYRATVSNADPFGYLNQPSNFPPSGEPFFIPPHYSQRLGPWADAPGMGSFFGEMTFPFPAQAEPIHPFCYVSFGAGMRQKEVDTYTANHKLEARYLMGSGDGISYHVPL